MSVDRYAKFSERTRKAIALSQEEGVALGHSQLGPHHLLLGLVRSWQGDPKNTSPFDQIGITLPATRTAVESLLGRSSDSVLKVEVTGGFKQVMEQTVVVVQREGFKYIDSSTLYQGLLEEVKYLMY